jgi:hypothetical protein
LERAGTMCRSVSLPVERLGERKGSLVVEEQALFVLLSRAQFEEKRSQLTVRKGGRIRRAGGTSNREQSKKNKVSHDRVDPSLGSVTTISRRSLL